MAIRKILCPTDFSLGSRPALQLAARLAVDRDAELVLAHVWHVPTMAYGGADPFPAETIHRMVRTREEQLAGAVAQARELGAPRVSAAFLTGTPWDQIVETLNGDPAFDLAVLGSHGRTGVARLLLGSVTEKVVRHAPCSVLAARPREDVGVFRNVLCPIDFSETSRVAMDRAAELAIAGGTIKLLHIVELPVTYSGEPSMLDYLDGIEQRSTSLLADWASQLRQRTAAQVTTELRIGSAGPQTLAAIDQDPTFDLVVVGSHGRTGLRRALLGSVAERIVRHAACPVFVARPRT